MPKTMTLCASDKQRAALAARLAQQKPAQPKPPEPPKPKLVEPEPPEPLNEFEIAGRVRRAAHWERMHRVARVREQLIARFPLCFRPSGEPKLPLKIGIDRDIFAALSDVSRNDIKLTLADYVRDPAYRRMLVEGAMRVDLDGVPTTVVTQEEARWPPKQRPHPRGSNTDG